MIGLAGIAMTGAILGALPAADAPVEPETTLASTAAADAPVLGGGSQASPLVAQPPPQPSSPAGRSDGLLEGIGMELSVNNDKPEITLAFGRRLPPSRTVGDDGVTARFSQISWDLSASAPFGGKDDLTDPQTLDKLSNGSSLTFNLSQFSFSNSDAVGTPRPTGSWKVGGEATVGFNSFDYRDPGTLTEQTRDETQYSAGLFIAYYPSDFRSMISVGAKYQYAFEAQDEAILCKPVVLVPADDCSKASPGPPVQSEGMLFNVEYRRTFDIGLPFGELGLSPVVTYDESSDDFGIELPIYLVPSAKSSVLPGIRIGYSTENDETTFGVFLKSSFGL